MAYMYIHIGNTTYIFGSSMIGHQRERQLVALSLVSPLKAPLARKSRLRSTPRLLVASAAATAGAVDAGRAHADHRYRSNPSASANV